MDEIIALIYYVDKKSKLLGKIEENLFERIIEQGNEPLTNDKVEKAFVLKYEFILFMIFFQIKF